MTGTLRWRLTLIATLVVLLGLTAGSFAFAALLSRSRVDALGELAAARADTVLTLIEADQLPRVLPTAEPGEVVQVLDADGGVLATSASASRTLPLATPEQLRTLDGGVLERPAYGSDPVRVEVRTAELAGQPVTVVAAVPLRDVLSAFAALRTALLVVVPVLSSAVGALSFFLLGRALRPVDDLRRGAEAVTALGGRGTLPVPAAGELAALADTLNRMLDRLHAAAERQSAFVGDAAHELRSPLAAVRTTVEVAMAHPASYDLAGLAGEVHAQVLRLQQLVDDLLQLAAIGARPPRRDVVDLRLLAEQEATGPTEVSGEGTVTTDQEAVRRILRNLIDNAVRHAVGQVRVQVSGATVTVADDGPGIPAADRERVFQRFTRLDAGRDREAGGTGLGLAIARETARALQGDVTLAERDGAGARFVLRLDDQPPEGAGPVRASGGR